MAETEESLLSPSADTYQLVSPPLPPAVLLLPSSCTMRGSQSDAGWLRHNLFSACVSQFVL